MEPLALGDPAQVGPYRLLGRLGAGGMGRVYLGRSADGREAAVKVVRPELAEERDFRRRFAREVMAARAVGGRHTAAVMDADPDAETPWLATAYVRGPSLADHVADRGPLEEADLRRLTEGLAHALAAIHAAGLVHRDLKPSNILLADDGPRVIDFGIARAAEASALTRTGVTIGSPGYMSPEQINGHPVETSSDVFSVGAVLAYAATGRPPFGAGATPALLYRVVHSSPDLAQVPASLLPLIAACLDKRPEARPTVPQILDTVAPRPTFVPPAATRTLTKTMPVPPAWSRRRLLAAGGAAAVVVTAGAFTAPSLVKHTGNKRLVSGPRNPPQTIWRRPSQGLGGEEFLATPDSVIFNDGADGEVLYALDAATTGQRWRWTGAGKSMVQAVALSGNTVYASTYDNVHALDIHDGRRMWSTGSSAKRLRTSAGVVVASSEMPANILRGLDPADGKQRWAYTPEPTADVRSLAVSSTVAVIRDATGPHEGKVYVVDATTGQERWRFTPGGMLGDPAATSDTVYIGNGDSPRSATFYAFDALTGRVRWKSPVGQYSAAPVVDDTTVYVIDASSDALCALDAATGQERWRFRAKAVQGVWGPVNGVVYGTSFYDMTYALDTRTGRLLWSYSVPKPHWVAATNATVVLMSYINLNSRTLYGLRPP